MMKDLVHQGLLLIGHGDRRELWVKGLLDCRRGFQSHPGDVAGRGGGGVDGGDLSESVPMFVLMQVLTSVVSRGAAIIPTQGRLRCLCAATNIDLHGGGPVIGREGHHDYGGCGREVELVG